MDPIKSLFLLGTLVTTLKLREEATPVSLYSS